MTTATTTLTDFLLARIAEDEVAARDATQGRWEWEPETDDSWPQGSGSLNATWDEWRPCPYFCIWGDPSSTSRGSKGSPGHEHLIAREVVGSWGYDAWGVSVAAADANHIVRYNPARVLAECAAKRAIVADHVVGNPYADPDEDPLWCRRCQDRTLHDAHAWPCPTIRHLAAIYADHPDYDESWRP